MPFAGWSHCQSPMRQLMILLAILPAIIIGVRSADGQAQQSNTNSPSRWAALLGIVPADAESTLDLPPFILVDYRAAERAGGVAASLTWPEIKRMPAAEFERWYAAMSRIQMDPFDLARALPRAALARRLEGSISPPTGGTWSVFDGLVDLTGVEWSTVDTGIMSAISLPPDKGKMGSILLALAGDVDWQDQSALPTALQQQGMAVQNVSGVQVWHRLDDLELKPEFAVDNDQLGTPWHDPFGIRRGSASRVALLSGLLVSSPMWSLTQAAIASSIGTNPSLADVTEIRAAVDFLASSRSERADLVQTALFGHSGFEAHAVSRARLGPYVSDAEVTTYAERLETAGGTLPLARALGLADVHASGRDFVSLVMVYRHRDEAEAALGIVIDRLAEYKPATREQSLADQFDLELTTSLQRDERFGHFAAVISAGRSDHHVVPPEQRGHLFGTILKGILNRDADYLVFGPDGAR